MRYEKLFAAIIIGALALSIPVSASLSNKTGIINTERQKTDSLQIKIKSTEQKLQEHKQQLDQKDAEVKERERQNQELQKQLQSKAAAKLAAQQAPQPVAASGSCQDEIAKYSWSQSDATKIMMGESSGNPGTVNYNPATLDHSIGCFQINIWGRMALTRPSEAALKSASTNVAFAYGLWKAQGNRFCTSGGWINTCRRVGVYN